MNRAQALMIQGTGSGVGKSLVAAAFCRIFSDEGISVAPFKAQNMALNAAITAEGAEIGRAQALQADAARIKPTADMNPILLKTSGENGSQVIIHGKVHATMHAREYYSHKKMLWAAVADSYDRLAENHELIVIEGAGSPAEINLMDVDIVNMAMARHADAPVILVGDIDKGGVFASFYGTIGLLAEAATPIKGFLINKFRGDRTILEPGLRMIEAKTGRPVIGVLPYLESIGLPEEDGLSLSDHLPLHHEHGSIRIVVIRHRSIANFTDFDALRMEPDVSLIFSHSPSDLETADLVIIPGSKNTVADLKILRTRGFEPALHAAHERGVPVVGICGGYQMLGKRILDEQGIESSEREVCGLGLLNITTRFQAEKTTCLSVAELLDSRITGGLSVPTSEVHSLRGYEIHMGDSSGDMNLLRIRRAGSAVWVPEGSQNGSCWGTYLHGLFDNDAFRRAVLNDVRHRKGLPSLESGVSYHAAREAAIDRLSDVVRNNCDLDAVRRMIAP
ncbi:MAG: adenosylcobyric acid synthase [Nitrospirae bacterium]|nr:MAG: adenosylcobyric acid synthase [Nitrospirota bacterium]